MPIKKVFDDTVEAVSIGKQPNMYQIHKQNGYSHSSARALKATQTQTWQFLLDQIKDEPLLERLTGIALESEPRASIGAIKMLLDLKDRFPAGKLKIQAYQEELENLKE